MPHIELNSLSVPPGAAEWTVFVVMLLTGLCFVGLAAGYAWSARRPLGARAGQHRSTGAATGAVGGRPAVCALLGGALLVVAASVFTGMGVG
ncbi:hypothetical protein [Halostreptopolyspora alba]|uniref:Uncharacterized protein n=1 Tax=Halostreptopolyspora alba TaxID=2487137 RepID=A0A3N0E7V5_9ACTN|nr:hypothetical protein EFW17_13640 [Nocardiopsaceae bacterium YIM 96095]